MKVGILGSGDLGQALGKGFVARGHDVKLASHNPKGKAPRRGSRTRREGLNRNIGRIGSRRACPEPCFQD
ncbi:MAG: NAD(P)-binding domain-containing protein [Thermoplasmata archaeon]